ncbi:dual specificity protein phosphatase family protein [Ruminococcus albus]|uniref:Uncharacterized protein n=1 Tax=Ruminococcus albus (strain ATCC 27210 / DSM 20455 / JCM 14654 / NCDO 2250 / 7) TaxID=697329 RepID=E6UCN7_RUMA7|nr:dual specificity protein phosphatase family protein [Ruminococcus albus]ADU21642.1 hypothetical protein Rumal_1117 [Ruminococcus albus 7 = DSM 20455]
MNVTILSRKQAEELIADGRFPENSAVISFYDPQEYATDGYSRVDFSRINTEVFYVEAPDIDWDSFENISPAEVRLIKDISELADFIYAAFDQDKNIICQCDFGQSRSAGCAAAIMEHFNSSGKTIFEDRKYFPNQMIFAEVLHALIRKKREMKGNKAQMKVYIYSREQAEKMIAENRFPTNTAVISFYDPAIKHINKNYTHIDYSGVCDMVFYSELDDLDIDVLGNKGYTFESYFSEADDMAAFVKKAFECGRDIVCQCEYGQSRSAGCAAAILEHFYHTGITVFADYARFPNQLVFNKLFEALEKTEKGVI